MKLQHRLFATALFVCASALTGCESATIDTNPVKVEPVATADPKALLMKIAESGQGGSAVDEVRQLLEKKKAEGDAKAGEVLPEVEALMNVTNEAEIKQKAKAIADKL